jgi:hypothetical protein
LVFGWIFAAHQLGAGLMAMAACEARDAFASYPPAFLAAWVVRVIAALSLPLRAGEHRSVHRGAGHGLNLPGV